MALGACRGLGFERLLNADKGVGFRRFGLKATGFDGFGVGVGGWGVPGALGL